MLGEGYTERKEALHMRRRVTKKEIREFLRGIRDVREGLGWDVWRAGAYRRYDKIELYAAYSGQGLNEVVYNARYHDIVEFLDIIRDIELTMQEKVDIIYDRISKLYED